MLRNDVAFLYLLLVVLVSRCLVPLFPHDDDHAVMSESIPATWYFSSLLLIDIPL